MGNGFFSDPFSRRFFGLFLRSFDSFIRFLGIFLDLYWGWFGR